MYLQVLKYIKEDSTKFGVLNWQLLVKLTFLLSLTRSFSECLCVHYGYEQCFGNRNHSCHFHSVLVGIGQNIPKMT